MRASLIVALLFVGCGEAAPVQEPAEVAARDEARAEVESPPAQDDVAPPEPEVAPRESMASIRARSSCAFESAEALCEGFREHYLSASPGWVSDGCALGEQRVGGGAFAEVRVIGIRVGHDPAGDEARVERPLLTGSVREPPGQPPATTQLLLAARVGQAWFPVHVYHPSIEGELLGSRVEWSLDESGSALTWTAEEGASRRDDPHGYGQTDRTIAVVDRGVPMIAAQATIERWRGDVDLECVRACNRAPSPPPYPGCDRRCGSRVRATRSWERVGDAVRIGATEVQREGGTEGASEVPMEEAETRRLDAPDEWMSFCAFGRVVRAVAPPSLPADAASVAARERAREIVARGHFRELRGARAAAVRGAPRATIEIYEQGGSGCGGGGCTTMVGFRTIEGSMPEEGVHYFANERGNQVGCDAASLPEAGRSTFVEVAPAISREAIGCGFGGYDGTAQRHWVIVRVLDVTAP